MIHLNIGSNLSSFFGSRYDNITIAINLLIESKLNISKISNFYETPSYPNKRLPKNWEQIPGAQGCTLENSNFRDNYENFLELNSLPIGISTQNVDDIKEMTQRLKITHDILSDSNLECTRKLSLPTFSIENHVYLRRITLIVEKNMIKKAFFPVLSVHNHVNELLEWLRIN